MQTYLERYQQGEHTQVWQDLVALGDVVWREPHYTDALAVAQETMSRARHNVDILVERLTQLGFQFYSPNAIVTPISAEEHAQLDEFERRVGRVPLSLRAWLESVGRVNFMGNYPRLSYYAASFNPLAGMMMSGGKIETVDLGELLQSQQIPTDALPTELTNAFANLQRVFQQLTGGDLFAAPRDDNPKTDPPPTLAMSEAEQVMSDPLVVDIAEISVEAYEEWQEYGEDVGPFFAIIAPDVFHKSNISGGDSYQIYLPAAAADAPLLNTDWGDLTFVEYLRRSFAWAGFPGLQDYEGRDEALLASLKDGLLPL